MNQTRTIESILRKRIIFKASTFIKAKMQARDGGDIPDLLGGRDIKNTLIIYIKNVKMSS
jgi:hypothetical protein